jgi:DNA-binding LacI/PurR family transcriptional regulator
MLTSTPVTQRDVAQACGLHHSTVCLALKNSPTLAPETRHRIQATARELGYQPNVSAYNLASRRRDRTQNASLPLAWINQEADRNFWRTHSQGKGCFAAVRQRAAEQGFHLDEFWAHEPGMSIPRLAQILRARGIQGLFFPVYRASGLDPGHRAWQPFSCVALNDHRLAQWHDVVSPDYYHLTDEALRLAGAGGPARVGLVLDREFDSLSNSLVRSCYLRAQDDDEARVRLPVCTVGRPGGDDRAVLDAWSAAWHPDVILCRDSLLAGLLGMSPGARVLPLQEPADGSEDALAAVAVETLVRKLQRFETGSNGVTRLHLVRGRGPALARRLLLSQAA